MGHGSARLMQFIECQHYANTPERTVPGAIVGQEFEQPNHGEIFIGVDRGSHRRYYADSASEWLFKFAGTPAKWGSTRKDTAF